MTKTTFKNFEEYYSYLEHFFPVLISKTNKDFVKMIYNQAIIDLAETLNKNIKEDKSRKLIAIQLENFLIK